MPVTLPMDIHHSPAHSQTAQVVTEHSANSAAASKKPPKTPARTMRTVTVRAGDSIYAIARREHSTVAAITKANPKLDPRHIVPGTKLRVPGPVAPKSSRPSTKAAAVHPHPAYAPKPKHVVTYAGTKAAHGYPAQIVASGDAHRKQLAKADLPTSQQLRTMIVTTAKRYGVSPTLALGIGMQESGFQQSAVSVCDAIGTMQVMPDTGRWAGEIVGKKLDLLQAQDNITAGITTLRYLTTHAKNQDEVIGSYYQGLGAMREHGPYQDTKQYIASVKSHMKHFAAR